MNMSIFPQREFDLAAWMEANGMNAQATRATGRPEPQAAAMPADDEVISEKELEERYGISSQVQARERDAGRLKGSRMGDQYVSTWVYSGQEVRRWLTNHTNSSPTPSPQRSGRASANLEDDIMATFTGGNAIDQLNAAVETYMEQHPEAARRAAIAAVCKANRPLHEAYLQATNSNPTAKDLIAKRFAQQ